MYECEKIFLRNKGNGTPRNTEIQSGTRFSLSSQGVVEVARGLPELIPSLIVAATTIIGRVTGRIITVGVPVS